MRPLRLHLRLLHLHKHRIRPIPLLPTNSLAQLHHLLHRIRPQQILVIQVVEENVDSLFHIVDLGFEGLRGDGFDAGDFWGEQVDDGLGVCGDVRAVASGILGPSRCACALGLGGVWT